MKLDHYEQFEAKCIEDADLLKRYKEKDIIYKFLTRLNSEFDPIRIQVLGKEYPHSMKPWLPSEKKKHVRGDDGASIHQKFCLNFTKGKKD